MHPEQKKILKSMTPEQKLAASLDLYYSAKKIKESWLQKTHPDWSEEKITREVKEAFLYART